MKLRFRQNSLRLRVNRREVEELAGGQSLLEEIHFPGGSSMSYILEPYAQGSATASFHNGTIRIAAPGADIKEWAGSDAIGMYFHLSSEVAPLKVSIEKDLECLDGAPDENDPLAFSRTDKSAC